MAAGHLVAHLDLAALRHIDPHHHVRAGRQLITLFTGVDAHVNNAAALSAGNAQGVVAHIAGLLTEDRAQQLLFRRLVGFALRRHLAHQDVAALHVGAHADDAHLIEVAQALLGNVRDLAGDLLRTELGLTGFDLVLLDVHRGVEVVAHQALRHQDRVLVVVALPGHVGDQHVLAEGDLAAFTGRAVGQHLTGDHRVAELHDRAVIQAGVLVGALVLLQVVGVVVAVFIADHDGGGIHIGHRAVHGGDRHHARVAGHLGFQAGAHERTLRAQQRHSLTLHVRAHQGAVGVVVLEEGDQRGGHGDHLHR